MYTKFFDVIMFVFQNSLEKRLITEHVYSKLVYMEFAKKAANNYRIFLELIEYFFRIIFIRVLQYMVNANKK